MKIRNILNNIHFRRQLSGLLVIGSVLFFGYVFVSTPESHQPLRIAQAIPCNQDECWDDPGGGGPNIDWGLWDNDSELPPGSIIDRSGGTFGRDGWTVTSIDDYIDIDLENLCGGNVSFAVTGLDSQLMRGRDYGTFMSVYDDYETGRTESEDYPRDACFGSTVNIGGEYEIERPQIGKTCQDIANGRQLDGDGLQPDGTCRFIATNYLLNDLYVRQNQGRKPAYRSSKQSDGAPFDTGDKTINDGPGQEPNWDLPDEKYYFDVSIRNHSVGNDKRATRLTVQRTTLVDTSFHDPFIIDEFGMNSDEFGTGNTEGTFTLMKGRLRIGNSSHLMPSGVRDAKHAIPGATFSNLKIYGISYCRNPEKNFIASCQSYDNTTCSNPEVQEDPPLFSQFDIDHPSDPFDVRIKWWLLIPTGVEVNFKLDNWAKGLKENSPIPKLSVKFSPRAAVWGEELSGIAQSQNFDTEIEDLFTAWFVDDVFQGGYGAGGEWITETIDDSRAEEELYVGPACRPVTRTPADGDDVDNDGMADSWERRYFPDSDPADVHPFNDTNLGYTNANLDGDDCVISEPKNEKGQLMTLPPKAYSSTGHSYILGTGEFSNLWEYIYGTDPTDPDTDSDGVNDPCDIAGLNQMDFTFIPNKPQGEAYKLRATTAGDNLHYLTNMESKEEKIYMGDGGELDPVFSILPSNPAPGDRVTVTANTSRGKTGPENLDFKWSMRVPDGNGTRTIDLCGNPDNCGVGKNKISTTLENVGEGQKVIFVATISERSSHRRVEKEYPVILQGTANITWSVCPSGDSNCGNCNNNDQVPQKDEFVKVQGEPSGGGYNHVWKINDKIIEDDRVHGDSMCFQATGGPGTIYRVDLTAYNEDGLEFEAKTQQILVSGPYVIFEVEPENPQAGQNVRVRAIPDNFPNVSSQLFQYQWTHEGVQLEDTDDTIEFVAGDVGKVHNITVSVELAGPRGIRAGNSIHIKITDGSVAMNRTKAYISQAVGFVKKNIAKYLK